MLCLLLISLIRDAVVFNISTPLLTIDNEPDIAAEPVYGNIADGGTYDAVWAIDADIAILAYEAVTCSKSFCGVYVNELSKLSP